MEERKFGLNITSFVICIWATDNRINPTVNPTVNPTPAVKLTDRKLLSLFVSHHARVPYMSNITKRSKYYTVDDSIELQITTWLPYLMNWLP